MVENKEKEEKEKNHTEKCCYYCKDICGVFLLGFQFFNLFTYLLAMLRGLQDLSSPTRD